MKRLGNASNNNIISFIGMILFVALFITAFIFLSYLFIIIAAFGAILVLIAYIKIRLSKKSPLAGKILTEKKGRIIEQDNER